ncbi:MULTISPECIES: DUF1656 domain-containing protein [Pseudomonas]|uniref:DUF1656 domain-containing protein n=1 Tax=Pseudomonas TaxID=286 RepID=UPI0015E272FD|nr:MULTISPECIES: DUF1656 domain-containing protein [Pseudomonas]MBA1244615.1 DUF1656 domain-containing protein [Pseudomonas japonica]MBA1290132.1 DUF1656 domain-containing protein [Pseudomonas japonica]
MPREIAFHGVYMPVLTVLLLLAMGLAWVLDRVLASLDVYRWFWHPALLRLSLFFCIFGALALTVYR